MDQPIAKIISVNNNNNSNNNSNSNTNNTDHDCGQTNSIAVLSTASSLFPTNHHLLIKHSSIDLNSQPSCSQTQYQQQQPQQQQQQHHLTSTNSFELNVVTSSSLSEDSGLPPTANSSISSGDSTRVGFCRFEFEVKILKRLNSYNK